MCSCSRLGKMHVCFAHVQAWRGFGLLPCIGAFKTVVIYNGNQKLHFLADESTA